MAMSIRYTCPECGWHGDEIHVLWADDPFLQSGHQISGCPECKACECLERACDVPTCPRPAMCSTPTKDGYVTSCEEHRPKDDEEPQP